MSEALLSKRRVNRAVAAVNEATGEHAWGSLSPLIASAYHNTAVTQALQRQPQVKRYASFEQLAAARRERDPHSSARKELESLQRPPPPRDTLSTLSDRVLQDVLSFLGPQPRELAPLASTSRRLRQLTLTQCSCETVELVPRMVALAALTKPEVMSGMTAYFPTHTRGQYVKRLALVEARYAATLPLSIAPPSCDLQAVLCLLGQLPRLTECDLRGVEWASRRPAVVPRFLTDLYLVAPCLTTLKVDAELFRSWTVGWWRRCRQLTCLVVGSRRMSSLAVNEGGTVQGGASGAAPHASSTPSTASSGLPPVVAEQLPADFFTMLASDRRAWRVKLWCPLTTASMRQLLVPSVALPGLAELTVNLAGNLTLCAPPDLPGPSHLSAEAAGGVEQGDAAAKRTKGKRMTAVDVVVDLVVFPQLVSFGVANVDERPLAGVELFARLSVVAPRLQHFMVCDTVRLPPPEKPKGKRRVV